MLNINIDLENIIIIILLLSEQSTFQLTLDNNLSAMPLRGLDTMIWERIY